MHYRNGREAKNGDVIVKLGDRHQVDGKQQGGFIYSFGVLYGAVPGNDFCNGYIAPITSDQCACLCDCLHIDDVQQLLTEKGLDKRPNQV